MEKVTFYQSQSTDPFVNLAHEEQILASLEEGEYAAFFYVNTRSVILGRFQVPWREVNLREAKKLGAIIVRRKSGGGCVYHDEGNLNFCFLSRKKTYSKELHFQWLLKPFQDRSLPIKIGEKDDLLLHDKKITGSAFRHNRLASYHHGTLLFSADLDNLSKLLRPHEQGWESPGICSRRAKVENLINQDSSLTIENYLRELKKSMKVFCDLQRLGFAEAELDKNLEEKSLSLREESWIFLESPKFKRELEIEGDILEISVKKGRVVGLEFQSTLLPQQLVQEAFLSLEGKKFFLSDLKEVFDQLKRKYPNFKEEFHTVFTTLEKGCF